MTPNPAMHRTLRIKPRKAGDFERWGAESMGHIASSHLQPLAQSPSHLVLPLRKVGSVPSFSCAQWFAAAFAPRWRSLPGAPVEAAEFVAASRSSASGCHGANGSVVSFGRPLLLGRLARVAQIRRVPSSARRGRRSASADFHSTGVACGGGGFVSRLHAASSALAPARIQPALPVNRSAPTPPSTGRCAIEPRSAGYVERYGSSHIRSCQLSTKGAETAKNSEETKKTSSDRWWEFYFVRYFVGSVIGGAIVFYLNSKAGSALTGAIIPNVDDVSKLDAHLVSMLAAMGLAFCYIASAPVLVLHATRGAFLTANTKAFSRSLISSFALAIALSGLAYWRLEDLDTRIFLAVLLLSLVLCFQLVPLYFALRAEGGATHAYYKALTKARSNPAADAKEYVESYKHLREHGNAFFIVFFEVALGFLLWAAPQGNYAILVLFLWIIPAMLVWFVGSVLEYRYSNDYQP